MRQLMRALAIAGGILLLLVFTAGVLAQKNPKTIVPVRTVRVGTYDKLSVVIAFYHSPQWSAILQQKQDERDAAARTKNTAKVKELENWGVARQELAMQQVLGAASIDNILEVLQPAFREIQRRLALEKVMEERSANPEMIAVDVTPQIMDWLKADDRTRQLAMDLREQQEKQRKLQEQPCPTLPEKK